MHVRLLQPDDFSRWIAMRAALWPDEPRDQLEREGRALLAGGDPMVVFVAAHGTELAGFLELQLRSVAEGCDSSPVPFVEGWYVADAWRRQGVGKALMDAAERWSRARGYTELASDTQEYNRVSRAAHAALGFEEVETLVAFRKDLRGTDDVDSAGSRSTSG
jgi:aminoglycoside 6'-N-acetyltransferase I